MTYEPCCLCVCCEVTPALPAFQETGCSCSPIIYKIPKLPTRPSENDREPQRTIGAGGRDHVCSHPALELTNIPSSSALPFPPRRNLLLFVNIVYPRYGLCLTASQALDLLNIPITEVEFTHKKMKYTARWCSSSIYWAQDNVSIILRSPSCS